MTDATEPTRDAAIPAGMVLVPAEVLTRRSQPVMDPPWSAAFNAALDMVSEAAVPYPATPSTGQAGVERLRWALEQIAGNSWRDQSRARHVARAALAAIDPAQQGVGE